MGAIFGDQLPHMGALLAGFPVALSLTFKSFLSTCGGKNKGRFLLRDSVPGNHFLSFPRGAVPSPYPSRASS